MISFDEAVRYILMLKEEAMENNYTLLPEQIELNKKVNKAIIEDINLKNKISQMCNANSISEMNMIWYGIKKQDSNRDNQSEIVPDSPVSSSVEGGEGKQYVLTSKKAGFVDAMIMALITGFVSGMAISVLFLMISNY